MIELLIVIALIAILSSILLPALTKARTRAQAIFCLNNTRQLIVAWHGYATDNDDRLANNYGGKKSGTVLTDYTPSDENWVNNVMDWTTSQDNVNLDTISRAALGPYTAPNIYRCPSDNVVSPLQMGAGWDHRIRSYSMNAMVGDAGKFTENGFNSNNPDYIQYFKLTTIEQPSEIFVFLDEHPDSINDGYFLNVAYPAVKGTPQQWTDLPASYHNRATAFSFADGHAELHRWVCNATIKPARVGGAVHNGVSLPYPLPKDEPNTDFKWVVKHMSVDKD